MDPISVRLGDVEQGAVDAYVATMVPRKKKTTSSEPSASDAIRTMLRRYAAICGFVKITPDEWQEVRADMERGGVLKQLVKT